MNAPASRSAPGGAGPGRFRERLAHLRDDDAGMSTAEYAVECPVCPARSEP